MLDELNLDEKTKSTLLSNIMRRLTPQAVKIRADIEVSCYAYEGIDAVKTSLLEGLKCSSEDVPIKVSIHVHLYLVQIVFNRHLVTSEVYYSCTSTIQNFNLKSYGQHAFSVVAPYFWNRLPEDIKNADSGICVHLTFWVEKVVEIHNCLTLC